MSQRNAPTVALNLNRADLECCAFGEISKLLHGIGTEYDGREDDECHESRHYDHPNRKFINMEILRIGIGEAIRISDERVRLWQQ